MDLVGQPDQGGGDQHRDVIVPYPAITRGFLSLEIGVDRHLIDTASTVLGNPVDSGGAALPANQLEGTLGHFDLHVLQRTAPGDEPRSSGATLELSLFEVDSRCVDFMDLYHHHRFKQAQSQVNRVAGEQAFARAAQRDDINALHDRLDRLTMLCEAMWMLLKDETGYTEEDLEARLYDLDMSDGSRDQRKRTVPQRCGCGAMVHPRSTRCVFCGDEAPERPAFDAV